MFDRVTPLMFACIQRTRLYGSLIFAFLFSIFKRLLCDNTYFFYNSYAHKLLGFISFCSLEKPIILEKANLRLHSFSFQQ